MSFISNTWCGAVYPMGILSSTACLNLSWKVVLVTSILTETELQIMSCVIISRMMTAATASTCCHLFIVHTGFGVLSQLEPYFFSCHSDFRIHWGTSLAPEPLWSLRQFISHLAPSERQPQITVWSPLRHLNHILAPIDLFRLSLRRMVQPCAKIRLILARESHFVTVLAPIRIILASKIKSLRRYRTFHVLAPPILILAPTEFAPSRTLTSHNGPNFPINGVHYGIIGEPIERSVAVHTALITHK